MATSAELLATLTSLDLVRLKDGVDVEAERLQGEAKEWEDKPHVSRDLASAYYYMADLSFRLGVIIDARIAEDKANHKTPF